MTLGMSKMLVRAKHAIGCKSQNPSLRLQSILMIIALVLLVGLRI